VGRNKEIVALVREAERLGFRTRHSHDGVIVYGKGEDDGVASTHWGLSDRRGVKNFRAKLKRIGVFDGRRQR